MIKTPQKKRIATKRHKNHKNFFRTRPSCGFFWLFLEQVIERAACVGRFDRGGLSVAAPGISRFALNGSARHEKLAMISKILFRNPCGNWLRALELSGRIEMAAILAGTKVRFALRALAFERNV